MSNPCLVKLTSTAKFQAQVRVNCVLWELQTSCKVLHIAPRVLWTVLGYFRLTIILIEDLQRPMQQPLWGCVFVKLVISFLGQCNCVGANYFLYSAISTSWPFSIAILLNILSLFVNLFLRFKITDHFPCTEPWHRLFSPECSFSLPFWDNWTFKLFIPFIFWVVLLYCTFFNLCFQSAKDRNFPCF